MTQQDLVTSIQNKMIELRNNTDDPEGAAGELAQTIAQGIHDYVLSLTITYSTGLVAPSGGGPVTGIFTSTLSLP